ncbi:MAG: SIS domain-containing protein, partial [Chloroflexi bacterium]|nr:SIS domain-containing protein [Chloroflexota bacterium]
MDFIDNYLTELSKSVAALSRDDLMKVAEAMMQAWRDDKIIFIIGNGGSAATASHMMNDFNKLTIAEGKRRFRAWALTDNVPLISAWGNDNTFDWSFSQPLRNFMRKGDYLIVISTSGNSPNLVDSVKVAREIGAEKVIGLVGDKGGKIAEMADIVVRFP